MLFIGLCVFMAIVLFIILIF